MDTILDGLDKLCQIVIVACGTVIILGVTILLFLIVLDAFSNGAVFG